MNSEHHYRNALRGLTPSPAWRESTLAAMKATQGKRARLLRRPLAFAAAAAVLALAVTGGIWWSARMEADPDDPGVARTPEPAITPIPSPASGQGDSFLLVTDLAQQLGSNPTAGHTYELSELPAYENPIPTEEEQRTLLDQLVEEFGYTIAETQWTPGYGEETMGREPTLNAKCTDGTKLRLSGLYTLDIYDAPDLAAVEETARGRLIDSAMTPEEMLSSASVPPQTGQETLETYSYDGAVSTTQVTFLLDSEAALEERIYSYNFQRITVLNDSLLTIYLQPGESVGTFPLRSPDDAQAAFRAGDYWGSCSTAHPDQAQILFVCLEYDTTEGQPYFQPVYRILYTQSYWDELVADRVFDGVDPSSYMGVGVAYVPAIDPAYQDQLPYRRYFNDSLAHFTPEDLP